MSASDDQIETSTTVSFHATLRALLARALFANGEVAMALGNPHAAKGLARVALHVLSTADEPKLDMWWGRAMCDAADSCRRLTEDAEALVDTADIKLAATNGPN